MLDDGTREATSLVRMRPETMNGWRPISVTYHPAMVATQPIKVIAANDLSIDRGIRAKSQPSRQCLQRPIQLASSIRMPVPTMIRNDQNSGSTGGWPDGNSF